MTSSALRSMTSVRSPPVPRVPVSAARSAVLGASARTSRSPCTARRQAPSQSASRAGVTGPILSDVEPPPADLLEAQRRAVTFPDRPLVVLGAAGTGKTRVLAERFRWLVDGGLRPEKIALVAASEGRADALREWLERGLAGGYDELVVATPVEVATVLLAAGTGGDTPRQSTLSASECFALLMERIDELPLERHDFAGSARALLIGFLRRIDRLKAHLITADDYARWAASLDERGEPGQAALEREFSEVYRAHERILAEAGVRDTGDLVSDALRLLGERGAVTRRFDHVLVDDGHELDLAGRRLATELSPQRITVAADPVLGGFSLEGAERISLQRSLRCPEPVLQAASAMLDVPAAPAEHPGTVSFWRCAGDRAQAQSVAADVERVLTR